MEELLRQFAGMGGFGAAFAEAAMGGRGRGWGGMGGRMRQRPMYRTVMTIPFEQARRPARGCAALGWAGGCSGGRAERCSGVF